MQFDSAETKEGSTQQDTMLSPISKTVLKLEALSAGYFKATLNQFWFIIISTPASQPSISWHSSEAVNAEVACFIHGQRDRVVKVMD